MRSASGLAQAVGVPLTGTLQELKTGCVSAVGPSALLPAPRQLARALGQARGVSGRSSGASVPRAAWVEDCRATSQLCAPVDSAAMRPTLATPMQKALQ
jgi:hypothetical protein